MTAEPSDVARPPDPGAAAVHLLEAPRARAVVRRPGAGDLRSDVGWGVLVLPVFGADPELSVEFTGSAEGDQEGPRWLACADLRRMRHDVVVVRGLLRAGSALAGEVPAPPEGAAHRVLGVFRMRPLPGRRIEIRLAADLAPAGSTGAPEPPGGPTRLEFRGTFVR